MMYIVLVVLFLLVMLALAAIANLTNKIAEKVFELKDAISTLEEIERALKFINATLNQNEDRLIKILSGVNVCKADANKLEQVINAQNAILETISKNTTKKTVKKTTKNTKLDCEEVSK